MDQLVIALKKALYDTDLFIVENNITTNRDSRTNKSDVIDYLISSLAICNNIQNLSIDNNLSSDHSAIPFSFTTKINKSISLSTLLSPLTS